MNDITRRFLSACHDLPTDTPVLTNPSFTSMDAMNALVIGDPRMDPNAQLLQQEVDGDDDDEAARDALLALEVVWHQGSSLIETVFSSKLIFTTDADASLCRSSLTVAWSLFASVAQGRPEDVIFDGEDIMLDTGGIYLEDEETEMVDHPHLPLRRAFLRALQDPRYASDLLDAISASRRTIDSRTILPSRFFTPRPASRLRQFMPMPRIARLPSRNETLDALETLARGMELEMRLDPKQRPGEWRMVLRAWHPLMSFTRARLSVSNNRADTSSSLTRAAATRQHAI